MRRVVLDLRPCGGSGGGQAHRLSRVDMPEHVDSGQGAKWRVEGVEEVLGTEEFGCAGRVENSVKLTARLTA
jgi:hypothetical protein